MIALKNYIAFIQDASEEMVFLFPIIFIVLSIITFLTQFTFTRLGKKKEPVKAIYHFTSDESLNEIRNKKIVNAGKNGRVFTTFNPNIRKVGSGKSKSKTPPTVIFRDRALKLFTSNQGMCPTGNKFNGSIFYEYSSIIRGNIKITKSKEYLNVIIISRAHFVRENGKRKFYLDHLSFLTAAHKWASQIIYIYAIIGLSTLFYKIPLVERNWVFLPILALCIIWIGLQSGKIFKYFLWEKNKS
ncbi:hypothetical protein [Pectobacterium carotovorum]|uniref:hypothetical protein n=1 Tax=Pectobacterium carotovorum TaxID=554 RepID=UPI002B0567D9|nr:hypothetical protein [Pectobacterium carotovorum]